MIKKITAIITLTIMLILIMTIAIGCIPKTISEEPEAPKDNEELEQKPQVSDTAEPPEISITIGEQEIKYVMAKNQWNGAIFDREDTFQSILKEGSGIEIPYIEIGETAVISFKNNPPAQLRIYDILINEHGTQIYPDKLNEYISVELKAGKCSFEIKKNMNSALSSLYAESKKDIRGFRIIANWENNECEYAFIIKTDAY